MRKSKTAIAEEHLEEFGFVSYRALVRHVEEQVGNLDIANSNDTRRKVSKAVLNFKNELLKEQVNLIALKNHAQDNLMYNVLPTLTRRIIEIDDELSGIGTPDNEFDEHG